MDRIGILRPIITEVVNHVELSVDFLLVKTHCELKH